MQSHYLLDTEETNLTCKSPMSLVRYHLNNKSACHLTAAEMQLELFLTFHIPVLLCTSGILLNLVNFCVFKKPHFEGPAYSYLAAISLVDSVFLVFYFIFVVSAVRCGDHAGRFPCNTLAFRIAQMGTTLSSVYVASTVSFTLQTACAWLTVLLGIERYMAMRHFHFRRNRCQSADTKLTVVLVCCASLLLNLPTSFNLRTRLDRGINGTGLLVTIEDTPFGGSKVYSAYSLVKLATSSLLPLTLLALNNTLLLILVLSHGRRARSGAGGSRYLSAKRASKVLQASLNRIRAQRRLTILLIVVIFVFLCGQVPRSLLFREVFALLYPHCPCGSSLLWTCCPTYRRLHPACELVYLMCLNLNFFIYAALNKHFRAHLYLRRSLPCRGGSPGNGPVGGSAPLGGAADQSAVTAGTATVVAADGGGVNCTAQLSQPLPPLPSNCCQSAPRIIYGIPSNGSPTADRRHSCVALSPRVANSVVQSMLAERPPKNRSQGSTVSVGSSSKSLCRSDDTFGPREEMDDLLGTAVMVSHL